MSDEIRAGMTVVVTDASGNDHEVQTLSGVENKGHAFPLVWVNRPLATGDYEPTPWPLEAVRVQTDA